MTPGSDNRVVGLDLGSSKVKACLFDLSEEVPKVLDEASVECPLLRPSPDWVEHDLEAMSKALSSVLSIAPQGVAIGWSSAMHALVLLDSQGRPLSNALSWADERSGSQAEALRQEDPEAYHRTGTPLHPMAWPAKLRWAKEQRRTLWKSTSRITDLKSYLWERLTGERAPLDVSSASATGLWNGQTGEWDSKLGSDLDHIALPKVAADHRLHWQSRELCLGAGDGPLGNLGLGAVGDGRVAMSVGTSGAVRQFRRDRGEIKDGLFLYALGELGWVEGGAISNGGSVMDWLAHDAQLSVEQVFAHAKQAPPGANGVRVYPYFQGERAPFWRSGVSYHIVPGQEQPPRFPDLARATLEGVAFCLRRLLDLMSPSGEPIRCTGGLVSEPFWRQLLANVCGRELSLGPVEQSTALGAALLTFPDALERARRLPEGELNKPDPGTATCYAALYEEWAAQDPEQART